MIRRSLDLAVDPGRAFRAWTEKIHLWWPPSHTRRGGRVVLDDRRFVEETDAGPLDIGRVVEWSPPHRLVYDFYMGSGPAAPSRVTVEFLAAGEGTRVEIEHVAHAMTAERFEANKGGYLRAWPEVLRCFTAHLETP